MKKRLVISFGLLIIVVAILVGSVQAEGDGPASWQGLKSGKFGVGFTTIEKYDLSRTFRPSEDYFGQPIEGETARPVQICYWYPAVNDETATPMMYGQYAYPYPADNRFIELLSALQNRELGLMTFFLNNDRGLLTDAMNVEMYGVHNADWAEGTFPIVIMHNDANGTYTQNLILCEYLASHGYVVVTTHGIGPVSLDPTRSAVDVETLTRDKELALGEMFGLKQVDRTRVAVIGHAFGTLTALTQVMRSSEIDALVSMESSSRVDNRDELLTGSTFYQPGRVTLPILQVYAGGSTEAEERLTAKFEFSDRTTINRTTASAMDYMSYPLIAGPLANPEATEPLYINYVATCSDILEFLNASLDQTEVAHALSEKYAANDAVLVTLHAGQKAPPTAPQFLAMFASGNIEQAIELEDKFKMFTPGSSPVDENTLNMTGYRYLQRGDHLTALAIFKMATTGYPESPNVWDSYGEGCLAAGDNQAALESYQKALSLAQSAGDALPQNLKEAILNNIPATIERLKALIAGEAPSGDGSL